MTDSSGLPGEAPPQEEHDAEGLAMYICAEAVKGLSPFEAHRVAQYLDERFFHAPHFDIIRQMTPRGPTR